MTPPARLVRRPLLRARSRLSFNIPGYRLLFLLYSSAGVVVVKIHIAINGAAGRMGQRLVHLSREDKELHLVAALEAPGMGCQGKDIGGVCGLDPVGVPITSEIPLS